MCLQRCHWQYWSVFIRLAVGPSEICEILWKFKLIEFKVIDLGANRKRMCTFLLATNSNFGRISYRFRDIDAFSSKIACFPHTSLVWLPLAAERQSPLDIDAIYIPLKSAFNGLQFHRWHYRSIFIRLAVVASQSREITRNSDKIWPYSSSRSSKVIDLGVNWNSRTIF